MGVFRVDVGTVFTLECDNEDLMKNHPWMLVSGALTVAALSFTQCSSDTTKTTSNSGTGGTTGVTPDSGANSAECQDYCTTIMANCTGGESSPTSNQQYGSIDNCLAVCKAFPIGNASDTSGNTLGCRNTHAHLAATGAALHCPHAGPGGDGTCGDVCEGYCQITQMFCVGTAKIYSSESDCMATCNATPGDLRFNISIQTGDEKACLLYHAQESPLAPDDHCLGDLMKAPDAGTSGGSVTCQ